MMSSEDDLRIDLLQIRRLNYRSRVHIGIEGDLFQKGTRGAKRGSELVRGRIEDALKGSKWKFPPRARIAASFTFISKGASAPTLYNLVKCYLDLLKGLVFSDDRQVYFLEASILKGTRGDEKPKTYVEVERLVDHTRRLDLYLKYRDKVEDRIKSSERFNISDAFARYLPKDIQQRSLIEMSEITVFDQPTNYYQKHLSSDHGLFRLNPFSVDLGDLPKDGETSAYNQRIQDSLSTWKAENRMLVPLVTPVALDIQVTPRAMKLGKDLDNILIEISRHLNKQVFGEGGCISAFRIYVTNKLAGEMSGNLRVKFLSEHGIFEFNRRVDNVLDKATDYIEEHLW